MASALTRAEHPVPVGVNGVEDLPDFLLSVPACDRNSPLMTSPPLAIP